MAPGDAERIGELLIEEGSVTHEELVRAISEGGVKGTALAAALEDAPHVRRSDLAAFLSADFRIPVLEDLRQVDFQAEAARLVPEELARRHEVVPVAKIGGVLCVAKSNYYNRAAVLELRRATHLKVKVLQADEDQVRAAIERVYRGRREPLPPAREVRKAETTMIRMTPPRVTEAAAMEAMPLITMAAEHDSATRARPVTSRTLASQVEEVIDILDAVPVSPQEFEAAAREPLAMLVVEFEEIFHSGKAITPYRMV